MLHQYKKAIPLIQKGRDLIACAQTGTGKTAAFVLPILDNLSKINQSDKVKAIIIAPTRGLAKQIDMQIEGFPILLIRHLTQYMEEELE